ncbi:hypothetical protein BI295_23015, partial [Mycobacterium avium subsp. hominissuis]
DVDRVRCGHRVNLLRLTWSSFEESRDDRPLPGYDTPPHVTSSYTTSLDATHRWQRRPGAFRPPPIYVTGAREH